MKSFICDIIETFCFPDKSTVEVSKKYKIEKVEIFNVLTDTDSASLKFMFISDPNSEVPESNFRDIIFEVKTSAEIYNRFDSSHEFWHIFWAKKEQKRK